MGQDLKQQVIQLIGREPTLEELSMFEVMFSEHCSYKSSRPYLKRLYSSSKCVVIGPGFDAGVISLDADTCLVFKVESHNHPSYIDPYNGSATGVGGIIRDILAMGATPIGVIDSLHFGVDPKGTNVSAYSKWLLKECVRGIADYGNSTGLPNLGGEIEFHPSFETNCLVNAGCIGVIDKKDIFDVSAVSAGDILVLIGNSTGRDGIRGVAFASETIDQSKDMRPAVQIADPFTKKLIIDALEEIYSKKLVKYVRDFGGGGLTSATTEMAYKLGIGLKIHLDKLPLREPDMEPWEILISESQERMLLVVSPDNVEHARRIIEKWTLNYAIIGEVTEKSERFKAYYNGKLLVDLDPKVIADAPIVERHEKESILPVFGVPSINFNVGDLQKILEKLLSLPNVCSREWVYSQYDMSVKGRTAIWPGIGASVFEVKEGLLAGVSCQSNAKLCSIEPYWGTYHVFMECYRSLVSVFCEPLAISDNLNFGNPEKPQVMWQFGQCIDALADSGRDFEIPCTGGNVSFYNENLAKDVPISPTPMIMMVGKCVDIKRIEMFHGVKDANDKEILLLQTREPIMSGSAYFELEGFDWKLFEDISIDVSAEQEAKEIILKNAGVLAANDISKNGMIVSLWELLNALSLGAEVQLTIEKLSSSPKFHGKQAAKNIAKEFNQTLAKLLFGAYYGYILLAEKGQYEHLCSALKHCNIILLGNTKPREQGFVINNVNLDNGKLYVAWSGAIERIIEG